MAELQALPFTRLKGARTDVSYTSMEFSDAVIARNCRMYKKDEVVRRKGGSKYNTTQYAGQGNMQGLYHFRYGNSLSKMLSAENGVLYTDTGSSITSIKTGFSSTGYFNFESYDDFCWITDGGTTSLKKYDGTTVTEACLAAPVVGTFAATEGTSGNVDGTVSYLVTFYVTDTGQESVPFPLTDAVSITVTSKAVELSGIPISSDSQVTARRIYRTTDGGALTSAQLVGTISDNTTTIYTDNIADGSLGAIIDLAKDPAPIFVKTVSHNERGFGFTDNSSLIYYSKYGEYWYYPQGNDGVDTSADAEDYREPIGKGDGSKITNIVKFDDFLIIFKENSVWVLEGYDRPTFNLRRLEFERRVGCVGHRAAVVAGNWCYFIDANGIYRTNGLTIEPVGEAVAAFFNPFNTNTSEKVDFSNLHKSVAIEYATSPNKLVKFSVPTRGDTSNSLTINYDYINNDWTWDTGFHVESWAIKEVSNQDVLMYGDDYGFIWNAEAQEGDGGLINGTATSAGASTLTDTSQSWTTNLYSGVYIEILSGTGIGQRRLIASNTADTVTLVEAWQTTPDSTSVYTIGGIDFYYLHCWNDYAIPTHNKIIKYINPWIESTGNYDVVTFVALDLRNSNVYERTLTLTVDAAWDVNNWDVMKWDDAGINYETPIYSTGEEHRWSAVGVKHKKAGQPVNFKGYNKLFYLAGLDT